jgi:hypothetical protein
VLGVDVSPWLRPDAATSDQRLFCHVYGRAGNTSQLIPGWPYSFVAALSKKTQADSHMAVVVGGVVSLTMDGDADGDGEADSEGEADSDGDPGRRQRG